MATTAEREQLLSVACPWCGAKPRAECTVGASARRLTTLDGGCHDARWRAALGTPATVTTAGLQLGEQRDEDREPVLVGAVAAADRPW